MPNSFEFVVDEPFYKGRVRGSFDFVPDALPPSPPAPTYPQPAGYYPLNGDLTDHSGNGRDLSAAVTPVYGPGSNGTQGLTSQGGSAFRAPNDLITGAAFDNNYAFGGWVKYDGTAPDNAPADVTLSLPGPGGRGGVNARATLYVYADATGLHAQVRLNDFSLTQTYDFPSGVSPWTGFVSLDVSNAGGSRVARLRVNGFIAGGDIDLSGLSAADQIAAGSAQVAPSQGNLDGTQVNPFVVNDVVFLATNLTPDQWVAVGAHPYGGLAGLS